MTSTRTIRTIVAAFAVAAFMASAACAAPVVAKATKVKGDVKTRPNATAEWKQIKDGDPVKEGAQVKTGASSEAFIGWSGGHVLKVGALSMITVANLSKDGSASKSNIELNEGKVFAKAGKLDKGSTFTVKTPTAVAGVRGTGFEATPSDFSVVEGTVVVNVGGVEVELSEGMMLDLPDAAGAALGEPEPIPAEDLKELKEDLQESVEVTTELNLTEASAETTGAAQTVAEEETSDEAGDAMGGSLDSDTLNDLSSDAASGEFEPGTGGIEGIIIITQ